MRFNAYARQVQNKNPPKHVDREILSMTVNHKACLQQRMEVQVSSTGIAAAVLPSDLHICSG